MSFPSWIILTAAAAALGAAVLLGRYFIWSRSRGWNTTTAVRGQIGAMVVLGSGGHTAEMLMLLSRMDFQRCVYIYVYVCVGNRSEYGLNRKPAQPLAVCFSLDKYMWYRDP